MPLERAMAWAAKAAQQWDLTQAVQRAALQEVSVGGGAARVVSQAASQTPPEWLETLKALAPSLEEEMILAEPPPVAVDWIRNIGPEEELSPFPRNVRPNTRDLPGLLEDALRLAFRRGA